MTPEEEIQFCKENNIPYKIWDYDFTPPKKNPEYNPPNILDNKEWIKDLYKNILLMEVKDDDEGLLHWLYRLKNGEKRELVLNYFKQVAHKENQKESNLINPEDLFDNNGNKKVLVVAKNGFTACYLISALLNSIKQNYPDHDIYICTENNYIAMFEGNPLVHKIIPYNPQIEDERIMIGAGTHKGFVDVYFHPSKNGMSLSAQNKTKYE